MNTQVNVFNDLPRNQQDMFCRDVLDGVKRYFQLPGVREKYEQWLKEREGGTQNESNNGDLD